MNQQSIEPDDAGLEVFYLDVVDIEADDVGVEIFHFDVVEETSGRPAGQHARDELRFLTKIQQSGTQSLAYACANQVTRFM
jgi:hypothetical protein